MVQNPKGKVGDDNEDSSSTILEIAYCVKCKKKVLIIDSNQVSLKGGKAALQGFCPDCGTKVFRIIGKQTKSR